MCAPWERMGLSYNTWFYDKKIDKTWYWKQEAKKKTCENYLWRYNNFIKGQDNKFILKSTFGKSSDVSIQKELDWWFNRCVGANTKIYI